MASSQLWQLSCTKRALIQIITVALILEYDQAHEGKLLISSCNFYAVR